MQEKTGQKRIIHICKTVYTVDFEAIVQSEQNRTM
jgi:hypothetical protein